MSTEQNADANAASSAAADSIASPVNLDELSTEQLAEWRLNGKVSSEATKDPASSTGTAATEQPASTDAKAQPASDAGAPGKATTTEKQPDDYKERTAKRFAELDGTIKDLRRQLSERNTVAEPKKAAPAADSKVDLKTVIEKPNPEQPLLPSEKFFEQFPDATWDEFQLYVVNHRLESRDHARRQADEQRQADEARESRIKGFVERISDPAFVETLLPEVFDLVPAETLPPDVPRTARNILAQEVMESEHAKELLQSLTLEDLAAVDALRTVPAVIRFVARLEARVAGSAAPAAKKAAPSKTVSDAPAPGTTLGSKARTAANPVEQAIADDDFVKFRELENAREAREFASR